MTAPFISITKDRGDRWIFAISFDWLLELLYFPKRVLKNIFGNIVAWLLKFDFPSTKVTMSVASFGLVAGLLLVIIGQVYSSPSTLFAVPTFLENQSYGPKIDRIKIDGIDYTVSDAESYQSFFSMPRKTIAHLQTSGRPGEAKAVQIMVGFTHPARSLVQRVGLGDVLSLVGDNNGRYEYAVVAVEVRSQQDLSRMQINSEQLVLIIPQTAIQQEFLVLIAR